MTNFSVNQSAMSEEEEIFTVNYDFLPPCRIRFYTKDIKRLVIFIFICFVSILGLLGNGSVIWLLGFRMKRNPFTIYILNLAVADFGVVTLVSLSAAPIFIAGTCRIIRLIGSAWYMLFHVMFSISQFLLTSISIDRCVSVLFPLWYRCHRPENLSTILCALIWIFCFLVHGICDTLQILVDVFILSDLGDVLFYAFLVNAVVCLPLITISTMILFIRFCFKSQQRQRKKLLTAILLALFFFLFLAFPLNVFFLIIFSPLPSYEEIVVMDGNLSVGLLCASLNSCVNPLIYFLVGRNKRGLCRENLKLILQRVFKQEEEEVHGEELQPSVQPQVPA